MKEISWLLICYIAITLFVSLHLCVLNLSINILLLASLMHPRIDEIATFGNDTKLRIKGRENAGKIYVGGFPWFPFLRERFEILSVLK